MHRSAQHIYSITSSARASRVSGTVRPSALAVQIWKPIDTRADQGSFVVE
jgi:hypothetical protein